MGQFLSAASQGLAGLTPTQDQSILSSNYLQWTDKAGDNFADFAQQYLPELYEQEVERFGNRTLSGFLRMVGAEMPMTSDQVIWSEQNRLHIAYKSCTVAAPGGLADADITLTIDLSVAQPNVAAGDRRGAIRQGQTVLISDNATGLIVQKGLVQAVSGNTLNVLNVKFYGTATNSLPTAAGACNVFVYGSEFGKGSIGMQGSIQPEFTQYANRPMILKDNFEINGSDTAQIGWVEVATEDGQSGYLWYLKSESETRLRFEDMLEMAMVEAENMYNDAYDEANNAVQFQYGGAGNAALSTNIQGSEGLFAAIEARGNVYSGFAGAAAPGSGALADFDEILKNLDKQGAIEENMLFLSRATALDFDDMIAAVNGAYASSQAASYGLFENDGDMALNFGFSGFRRGSYDFYKTDWKYLNDKQAYGGFSPVGAGDMKVAGCIIPAGVSTVYDEGMG